MNKVAAIICLVAIMNFAACQESADDKNRVDSEQTLDPANDSGPTTEAERATDATKDSANADSDSTVRRNADAPSTPH